MKKTTRHETQLTNSKQNGQEDFDEKTPREWLKWSLGKNVGTTVEDSDI